MMNKEIVCYNQIALIYELQLDQSLKNHNFIMYSGKLEPTQREVHPKLMATVGENAESFRHRKKQLQGILDLKIGSQQEHKGLLCMNP
jgi:hypothetical protein